MIRPAFALIGIALLAGSALAHDTGNAANVSTGSAKFIDGAGKDIGSATLTAPSQGGLLIALDISGLPASSWVAFHVHETGKCDPATKHDSAGGHFNPGGKEHGYKAAKGAHAGDMPNQYVGADGHLRAQVYNPLVTLGDGPAGITNRALMIHAKADDYESQPSGSAGDRLACGVVE